MIVDTVRPFLLHSFPVGAIPGDKSQLRVSG